jgi:hypothetical protein
MMANEPNDETDPARLRRFAKRIAEMKWWREEPKAEQSERTSEQPSQQPQSEATPDQQQGEAGNNQAGVKNRRQKPNRYPMPRSHQ